LDLFGLEHLHLLCFLPWVQKCENKSGKSIGLGSTAMESSYVTTAKRMREHDSQNQNFPG